MYSDYTELQDWCNKNNKSIFTAHKYCKDYHIPLEIKKDGRCRIAMIKTPYLKALEKVFADRQVWIEKRNGCYIKPVKVYEERKDLKATMERWIKDL